MGTRALPLGLCCRTLSPSPTLRGLAPSGALSSSGASALDTSPIHNQGFRNTGGCDPGVAGACAGLGWAPHAVDDSAVCYLCCPRCARNQSGLLINPRSALDGLLGMGDSGDSVLGQLAVQKVLPLAFSYCLDSADASGSHAILGRGPAPSDLQTVPLVKNPSPF